MNESELERRFLDFVYRTDAVITSGAIAYYTGSSLAEAEALLDRLAKTGRLQLEYTESGDLYYLYPSRHQLELPPSPPAAASEPDAPAGPTSGQHDLPQAAAPAPAVMQVGGRVPSPESVGPSVPKSGPNASTGTTACPMCGEDILTVAKKCKHCGEIVDPALKAQASQPVQVNLGVQNVPSASMQHARYTNPGVASLLSFLWPGAGQIYAQHVGAGIGWMFFTFIGYLFLIVPGLVLHLLCIFSAASYARDENRRVGCS